MIEKILNFQSKLSEELPIGTILAVNPFYYQNTDNGTPVLFQNNINSFSFLHPCDGSAPNSIYSPIWNSPNRYVPKLDDERFLMGSLSLSSVIGGSNIDNHSHNFIHYHLSQNNTETTMSSGLHTHVSARYHIVSKREERAVTNNERIQKNNTITRNSTSAGSHTHVVPQFDVTASVPLDLRITNSSTNLQTGTCSIPENRPNYLGVRFYIKIF